MAFIDEILNEFIANIEGSIGCAVIDAETRKLIASAHKVSQLTPNTQEALAVAAVELIRGKQANAIEKLLASQLSISLNNAVDDICVNAGDTRHFIAVLPENRKLLLYVCINKSTSIGMGWIAVGKLTTHVSKAIEERRNFAKKRKADSAG